MPRHCVKSSIHIISFNPYNCPDFTDEKLKHGVGGRGEGCGVEDRQLAPGHTAGQQQSRFWKSQCLYSTVSFAPTPPRLTLEGTPGGDPIA